MPENSLKKKLRKPKSRKAFLAAYAQTGMIGASARAAKIDPKTHWRWLQDDPEYEEAFNEAHQAACEKLEEEAKRRAIDGVRKKQFYRGDPIVDPETGEQYYEHAYSDVLLIFLMKGMMPEKYGERQQINLNAQANVQIIQDDNWYDNAERMVAETPAAPDPDANGSKPVQGNGVRPQVGKNGNGTAHGH